MHTKNLFATKILLPILFFSGAFVVFGKFQLTYAACGDRNEVCCSSLTGVPDGTACMAEGPTPLEDGTQCTCSGGITCRNDQNPLFQWKCSACSQEGDPCCYNDTLPQKYECQGGFTCDYASNTCVATAGCDDPGDGCCIDYTGHTLYCRKTKFPNLECDTSGGKNICYDANIICQKAGDPCCPNLGDPTGDGYCVGTVTCDPALADASAPKGRCRDQGLCGGNNQLCCTSGDPCPTASDGYRCINGYCVNPQPLVGYKGPIFTDIASLLAPIFKILFYVGIFVGILGIIYSGYLFISSEGDPGRVKEGKEQFTAAILGSLFVLLSVFILRVIINNILGVDSGL